MRNFLATTIAVLLIALTGAVAAHAATMEEAIESMCDMARSAYELGAQLRCNGISEKTAKDIGVDLIDKSARDIQTFKKYPVLLNLAKDLTSTSIHVAYKDRFECNNFKPNAIMYKAICITEFTKKLKGRLK